MTADLILLGFALLVTAAIMVPVVCWANRQQRIARALRARGWYITFPGGLFGGPVPVPPQSKSIEEIRADWQAVHEAERPPD